MKLSQIINEQELIPRETAKRGAASIGKQLLHVARQEAYKQRRTDDAFVKQMAEKLANRFHANILAAIDEEMAISRMKTVDKTDSYNIVDITPK